MTQLTIPVVPDWAKSASSADFFAEEQACLGEVWNFIGFESDIPNTNDWFRATLGGRSIFVQRFKDGLRAFENICPHRFNELRSEKSGNGHIVCSFHHWRFNGNGDAIGIPQCKEMYNKTPKEVGASLTAVALSVCGGLVFGRLGSGPSLQEWLGPSYAVLHEVTSGLQLAGELTMHAEAHWKLMMNITLDDYHIVAVHPATFGKSGYLNTKRLNYFSIGVHSANVMGGNPRDITSMAEECQQKAFFLQKGDFVMFQFFPTFAVSMKHIVRVFGDDYCYLQTEQLQPQLHDSTNRDIRFFVMPFKRPAGFIRKLVRKVVTKVINIEYHRINKMICMEDVQVCENLQTVAHQARGDMRLSAQEERVGWFEEAYAKYVLSQINQKDV